MTAFSPIMEKLYTSGKRKYSGDVFNYKQNTSIREQPCISNAMPFAV